VVYRTRANKRPLRRIILNLDFEKPGCEAADKGQRKRWIWEGRSEKKEEGWQALDDCGVMYRLGLGEGRGAERQIAQ
jgi:hypothetical protein